MTVQQDKVLRALALTIDSLRRPDILAPALRALGKRHTAYGVNASHYPMVGRALLGTLAEFLGADFTPRVRLAWADAFGVIMSLMLEGAEQLYEQEVPALARPA
jgi:hemoglobin-like flavoprotein